MFLIKVDFVTQLSELFEEQNIETSKRIYLLIKFRVRLHYNYPPKIVKKHVSDGGKR
jgi:hypothetical protein